ncbi:MAG TPA: hemerythrin domain-containing protein [Thermoanaerobaculia bacterium]|nr:hemerythrin domain-containing protein [Thermoanaerobaculia bacterium]
MGAKTTRREILLATMGAGLVAGAAPSARKKPAGPEVTPAEDLMREHGLLNRILLVYEEGVRRLEAGQSLSASVFSSSAEIVRSFIEEYHEKLEEENLFPRFEKAKRLLDLVAVLRQQHHAGRLVTANIQKLANPASFAKASDRSSLAASVRQFIRMYRPHEAREDTILFPALHEIVTAKEYEELGDAFEDREHRLFGASGFEKMVERVAGIERELGIYDLAVFTPWSPSRV